MSEINLKKIRRVDDNLLKEIVSRIVNAVRPDKIVLFGSYAYGRPKAESDLDLLIIMNSNLPRYKRAISIYGALAGLLISKDILVYTPEEIEDWSEVHQAFITTAIRKGKVIYEKEQG